MKLRFWIGVIMIALAAGFFAYRGAIVGYVVEKWEKRGLPEAVRYDKVAIAQVTASPDASIGVDSGEESPTNVVDKDFNVVGRDSSVETLPPDDEIHNPSHPPLTLRGGEIELPPEFNLAVPFTSQAPFAVWDEVHNDACEEASVMMVDAFYKERPFTPDDAEQEIQDNVQWETDVLGHWEDTTAAETARILQERYGYTAVRVVYEPTIEDIKHEVAQGHPVILPAAGRLLGNRYFRQPGPIYHMLVVRGWTKNGMIITNDPGTKRGEAYLYDPEVLLNAVHDWNGGDVENGRKVMVVVEK